MRLLHQLHLAARKQVPMGQPVWTASLEMPDIISFSSAVGIKAFR